MKYCSNCGASCPDEAVFCPSCGYNFNQKPTVPLTDHTAEFEAEDISKNKLYAMMVYLFGWIGVIVALLTAKDSPYVQFHLRQFYKLAVLYMLVSLAGAILAVTILVPLAAAVAFCILFVLQVLALFQVFGGKAKEIPIVCKFKFLD